MSAILRNLILVACILARIVSIAEAQYPVASTVEDYTVLDGDTMYFISLNSYTEEERAQGAHWLAIFEYNVDHGTINPTRTPVFLGPSGLSLHIQVGQKLKIPHYAGLFPSSASIIARFGVHDAAGQRLQDYVPQFDVPSAARKEAVAETKPILEVSSPSGPVTLAEPESAPLVYAMPVFGRVAASSSVAAPLSDVPPIPEFEAVPTENDTTVGGSGGDSAVIPTEPIAVTEGVVALDAAVRSVTVQEAISITPTSPTSGPMVTATEPVANTTLPATAAEPATIAEPVVEPIGAGEPPVPANAGESSGRVEITAPVQNKSGVEAYISAGASLYADSTGFNISIGVKSRLGDLDFPVRVLEDMTAVLALAFDGVFATGFPVMLAGADVLLGYRFESSKMFPGLPRSIRFRSNPVLAGGIMYQSVERNGREAFQGIAYHLAPLVGIDFPVAFDGSLRIGVESGYHFYFSDLILMNAHAGILLGWTF